MSQVAQTIDITRLYYDVFVSPLTVNTFLDCANRGSVAVLFGTSTGGTHPNTGNVVTYKLYEGNDTNIANATLIPSNRIVAQSGTKESNGSFVFAGPYTKETLYQVGVELNAQYLHIQATASNVMTFPFNQFVISQSLDGPTTTNADGSKTNFTVIVPLTT